MTANKFDSLIVNSDAGHSHSSKAIFESFMESQAQFEQLPAKLKKDPTTVKLNLFKEIHSRKNCHHLFRKQDSTKDALVNYWLSRVKNLAHLFLSINDIPKFNGLSKQELKELTQHNDDPEHIKNIEGLLSKKGIIFILEPSLDGLKTDGAVFKLKSGNPVVAMSLRHKRLDNFWFTLMHELAHVVLHYDKLDNYIIDDLEIVSTDIIELEANKLAGDSLIPRHIWRTCAARRDLKDSSIMTFSKEHKIHPAIIAGRIRKEINDYRKFNNLINSINTREILFDE